MAIKNLDRFMGKSINGALERALGKMQSAPESDPNPTPSQSTSLANCSSRDYYQIPGSSIVIAKEESLKGLNWYKTHEELQKQKLRMPLVPEFMSHFMNVLDAYKGNSQLHYADDSLVPEGEVEDFYKYLTTNYKNGCWTWLDAFFKEENGIWQIRHNHKFDKGSLIAGKTEVLESCLRKDCQVELDFNKQGMPIKKTKKQEYSQGNSIIYLHPRNEAVARFNAGSGRAVLYCLRFPSGANPALGVFACAEGATPKKSRSKNGN
ncbi:hypothetical protein HY449_04805 [Candidatus Pacearchaeota archaeon]|nr:hypothetical protein [Candidatus Pacearchaeota archaeon]